jgi:hypothetical protein
LHIHCFRPKRETQKLVFAHFNNLKQNFRCRPHFTDQRQQISHLFCCSAAGKFAAACREIAGARDIFQKFENLKKQDE